MICPKCKFKNPNKFKFCGKCGIHILDADLVQIKDRQERRQLTVMFCDLVGSTSISQKLDPESFHKLINEYQRIAEKVIEKFEGHIAQFLGDGILVYFGYPKAHEDDTNRAVKAAIEIREEIKDIDDVDVKPGYRLKVRIGIHTGEVVIGEVGGTSKRELLAMGEVPNIAALIQKKSKPNQILVSQDTHQLIRGFYTTRKVESSLKCGANYSITGEKATLSRFEARMFETLTPFVGRENEIGELINYWDHIKGNSQGKVCLISGEAGIGKSRLVYEFKESISDEPYTILEGQCWETAKNSPFSPIIHLLEQILEFNANDANETKIKKLENLLRRNKFKLKDTVPLFTNLLSLPPTKKYKIPLCSPDKLRKESMGVFVKLLSKFSLSKPVLFIVEDLQWADPSTLDLLTILIADCSELNILSVFTFRPEFKTTWNINTKLELNHLGRAKTQEMVENLIHGELNNAAMLKQVVDKSDGIPLYIEEITKTLLDFASTNKEKTMSTVIPITLNDHLMARLDNLGEAKDVAQFAAILGREFDQNLLKSLTTTNLSSLNKSLKKLIEDGIIIHYKPGHYIFKHALIQGAAYESIPRSKRNEYHHKTAEVIENKFAFIKDNHPELLAHHYEKAGDINEAVSYLSTAGELAISKYATLEAIAYLEKGLSLLNSLKASKDKDLLEISLCKHLQYALVLSGVNDVQYYSRISERLISLCEKWKLYDVVLKPIQLYVNNLYMIDIQRMYKFMKKMNMFSRKINNESEQVSCSVATASAYAYIGRYVTSSKIFDRTIRYYKSHKPTIGGFNLDDRITALGQSSIVEWQLGHFDISINRINNAVKLSEKSNIPNDLPFALVLASALYIKRNQLNIANKLSEKNITLCKDRGIYFYLYISQILYMHSKLKLNIDKESISPHLNEIIEYSSTSYSVDTIFAEHIVEIFMLMNMYDDAMKLARQNIEVYNTRKTTLVTAQIYKLMGTIYLIKSQRNKKKAEACYRQSLEIARKQMTRFYELETVNSYSKLLLDQGREKEAKKMLSRIVRWFDGKNKIEIPQLNEAKSMLAKL